MVAQKAGQARRETRNRPAGTGGGTNMLVDPTWDQSLSVARRWRLVSKSIWALATLRRHCLAAKMKLAAATRP